MLSARRRKSEIMKTFSLRIITPEGEIYDGRASRLIVRTTSGDKAVLYDHEPYTAILGKGMLSLTDEEGVKLEGRAEGGFISITDNEAVVLTDRFEVKSV